MDEGKRLGSYTLLSELGSGGMGTVHLAEVTDPVAGLESGQKVALKVIHPHLLSSPGFFKRFLREGELGRKVVHENVVRTFDVDALLVDDKQVNFMVMEFVEGRSLRELLDDLGAIPEALLREIAVQVSAGLTAIHAQGIVHRDLKPENILITDDHAVRILDLGVAKAQEASIAITEEGQFAGSLIYAAPEQFGPSEVGAAVDLYALGVAFYELATGENPFRRDDPASIIEAQLRLTPPRITDLNAEMTSFFAELVATLLEKKPDDRFESAEALKTVLQEAERSQWWVELAPKLRKKEAHLPKIRVRRETRLHGRDADLEALGKAWQRAKEGEGNILFLEGEAGIGRTRLLDAFLRELEETEIHVLYGSYPPSGGLGGISDAILEKFGEVDLAGALAPYLTVTPSLVPGFAGWMKREVPPSGTEPLQADALRAVCVHLMRALADEKPLVWIIEDLHFAPKESRDTVLALSRAVEGQRVLLVATARPGLPGDEITNFSRLENFQRLALGRLGAREVAELLEDAFQSEALAEKLGIRIAKKSDGVPFFILEMIRGLKEGQFIRQEADGTFVQTQMISDIEVPSAVKDLIEGRLQGLSEMQRAVLDVGAVQGLVFDAGLTAEVLDEKKVHVLRQIAEIERRFGLVRGEAASCRFDQNQIQEVLYRDLIPELRAEYHSLLAETYAAHLDAEPSGEDALFLASHHLRGGQLEKGVPHLLSALDYLERSTRNEAAIELAARALDAPGLLTGKMRAEALLRKAGRHSLRGE
ncbi:MAG: serine/threonine protein kinase, partial [Planctomycetota bacterium]